METLHKTSPLLFPPPTQTPIPSYSPYPQDSFTATELAAAEQLVQLSESSGDSALRKTLSSSSFSSSSSSPRSVNTRPAPGTMVAVAEDDEDEDEIGGASRRKRPRYRLIDDLYAATAQIDGASGGREKRRRCTRYKGLDHAINSLSKAFGDNLLPWDMEGVGDSIDGCDGSVLLNSKGNNTAEKDGPPNISLHAFYVIDNAKKAVEATCPGVVSCADILALAARDAVVLSGGPTWEVPKGRLDGRVSKASETTQLPAPTFNFSQLKQSFSQRGLSTEDLMALSGGHTLGFSHCSSFENRIHNFDSSHNLDPSMNPSFAASLQKVCPAHNKVKNAGSTMDSTTTTFDNVYYKLLLQGKSLFSSDQALLTDPKTKGLASIFATSQEEFNKAFVNSMIKMSEIMGGQEVRLDCRVVNGQR
ncbi:putative peroxidase 64 [Cocos nucifera]|uniref:Peroxidase n=1 Tax=Cocos nucifera TaxID=13894 RepID=A0A8K0IIT7_COCNU|nr:putative peroxidase 64 [Cocos nucifera]